MSTKAGQLQTFAYDALGNITSRDGLSYGYNSGKPHAVSHLGGSLRFGYDAAGNMTTRGSATLEYDLEGRLTKVTSAAGTEEYFYDGDGVLYRRKTQPAPGGTQFSDSFATQNNQAWIYNSNQTVPFTVDGREAVRSTGTGSDWSGNFHRSAYSLTDGQVVRVAFKLASSGTDAVFGIETGGTPETYHRFSVKESGGKLYIRVLVASQGLWPVVLMESVQLGTWYQLELAVDDANGFRATIWPIGDPGNRSEARFEMPTGKSWRFRHWILSGTAYLDDYEEVRPSLPSQDLVLIGKHYEKDLVSGTVTKRYSAGTRLLATRTGATLRYVLPDHLGSTTTLTDANGVVTARERYSAFGERRRGEEPKTTEYLFTGQRFHTLSGLAHFSDGTSAGRFYDPTLGRFVSADSLIPDETRTQALNRYAYSYNNPLKYTDPDGNVPVVVAAVAVWALANAPAITVAATTVGAMGWSLYAIHTTQSVTSDVATLGAPNASGFAKGAAAISLATTPLDFVDGGAKRHVGRELVEQGVTKLGDEGVSLAADVTETYTRIEFQGRRVYQRNDIDWTLTDAKGRTNLDLARAGRAPYGSDGMPVNLHHLLQEEPGPMAEVLQSVHWRGYRTLHGLRGRGQSFRNHPLLDSQYEQFRVDYWRWRASQIEGE